MTAKPVPCADARDQGGAAESNDVERYMQQSEATDQSYHLTHHVGGVERPLKLTIGMSSLSRSCHTASPNNGIGEMQVACADLDAKEPEIGHVSRRVDENHEMLVRRRPYPPAIVDDEYLRTYLDPGTSSSGHVRVDDMTRTSVPQPHASARNTNADRTSCPQHTTQGNLTHVNLSTALASLSGPERPSGRLPDARPFLRTRAVGEDNEHESFWRSFVLGSDPQSAIDTIHIHLHRSGHRKNRLLA